MKIWLKLIVCTTFWSSTCLADSGSRYSLRQAYRDSLSRSEDIASQAEVVTQSHESELQAKGAFYPTISSTIPLYSHVDRWGVDSGVSSPSNLAKISLTQPLFNGLRDWAQLHARKDQTEAQKLALKDLDRQLFISVSTAYFQALAMQSDLANYDLEIQANMQRLSDLKKFLSIGKAQENDVLTFKANIASLEAQKQNTLGQYKVALEDVAFFTGWPRDIHLEATTLKADPLQTIGPFLKNLDERPDVMAAKKQVDSARQSVKVASGQHLPSVDLQANYNFQKPGDPTGGGWSTQVVVSLPIFQGGVVNSETRQAESVVRQLDFQLSKIRRSAEREIRSRYASWTADLKQADEFEAAEKLGQKNYALVSKQFRQGFVTNLEVLQSLTAFEDARRLFMRAQITAQMDYAALLAASAHLEEFSEP